MYIYIDTNTSLSSHVQYSNQKKQACAVTPRACGDGAATCGNYCSWTFVAQRHGIALWWSRLPVEAMWRFMIQSSGRYSLKEVKCEWLIEAMPIICWSWFCQVVYKALKQTYIPLKGPTTIATSLTGKGIKWQWTEVLFRHERGQTQP